MAPPPHPSQGQQNNSGRNSNTNYSKGGKKSYANNHNNGQYNNKPRHQNNGNVRNGPAQDFTTSPFAILAKQYFSLCSKGSKIRIITINGDVWEAVCHLCDVDSLSVYGKCVQSKTQRIDAITEMGFQFKDIESYTILMEVTPDAMKEEWKRIASRSKFKTDTDISNRSGARERVLQKWAPESDSDVNLSLESNGASWDQFAVNEKLFGVTTDFNEDLYTTSIDRSDPDFARKEAEAARLAKEIESGPADNVHIAEERGLSIPNDDTMDEEDKYSSVIRPAPKSNVYQPPAKRNQSTSNQTAAPSTKPKNAWQKVVPPASSGDARVAPGPTEVKNAWAKPLGFTDKPKQQQPSAQTADNSSPPSSTASAKTSTPTTVAPASNTNLSKTTPAISFAAKAAVAPSVPTAAKESSQKPATNSSGVTSKPFSAVAAAAASSSNVTAKPVQSNTASNAPRAPIAATFANIVEKKTAGVPAVSNKPPVDEVVKSFKTFAVDEKKHLMQRKQIIMQMEKNVTINDFKKFSQDLKLPGPMPTDLQEILHKSEDKSIKGDDQEIPAPEDHVPSETKSIEQSTKSTSKVSSPKKGPSGATKTVPLEVIPVTSSSTTTSSTLSSGTSTTKPVAPTASVSTVDNNDTRPGSPEKSKVVDTTTSSSEAADTTQSNSGSKSSGFKLNVAAAEFTPGGSAGGNPNTFQHNRSPAEKYNRRGKPGTYQKGYNKGYHKNGSPKNMGGYVQGYEDPYHVDYNGMYAAPGYPAYPMYPYRPMPGRPPVMAGPPGAVPYVPTYPGPAVGFAGGPPPPGAYPPQQMIPGPRPRGPPGGSYPPPPPQGMYAPAGMVPVYPPEMMGFQQPMMVPVPGNGWVPMDANGVPAHPGMIPEGGDLLSPGSQIEGQPSPDADDPNVPVAE